MATHSLHNHSAEQLTPLFRIGIHPFTLFMGAAFFDRLFTRVTPAALFNRPRRSAGPGIFFFRKSGGVGPPLTVGCGKVFPATRGPPDKKARRTAHGTAPEHLLLRRTFGDREGGRYRSLAA
jgi:hypothetical protein